MSTLYIVATPIGNLADITFRAVETLKQVDVIACEDTRVTSKLLTRHDIQKPLVVYQAAKAKMGIHRIMTVLGEGKSVALVTDAGTPGISDPGNELVGEVRARMSDVHIVAIPGPSAITTALSIAGVDAREFVFLGFAPHKKGRETFFKEIGKEKRTVVFYESPHRIEKALESLSVFASAKTVTIARELTKMHEQVVQGTPEEMQTYFTKHANKVKGEFVVVVSAT